MGRHSLDLTLEDSQDDSPPESKDETRLSEASRSKGRDSTAVDEEWDETHLRSGRPRRSPTPSRPCGRAHGAVAAGGGAGTRAAADAAPPR